MKNFDWHSLLNIRQVTLRYKLSLFVVQAIVQTCKYLNVISKEREVWIGQYHQYVAQHVLTARIEEPLYSYSAEELERWVLLRRSADVGWMSEDVKFTQKRQINLRDNRVGGVFLVPGGRWLLIGGVNGSVVACDIDASTLRVIPLIPPDEDRQRVHLIAIDMKPAKQCPNLTFTMALSPASHLGEHSIDLTMTMADILKDYPLAITLSKFTSHRSL